MRSTFRLVFLACATAPLLVHAQFGFIDRQDEREDRGIWSRSNQKRLDTLAITGVLGLALAEGTETRLGRTAWQAVDAASMTAATTEVMKHSFQRPRPAQNPDPSLWFQGSKNRSFPSGETAMMAAFVTPFVVRYQAEYPGVWALAAMPAYMARARMASQGHWLSDVVVGAAIGAGYGWWATRRDTPLVLSVTGRSVLMGLRYRF